MNLQEGQLLYIKIPRYYDGVKPKKKHYVLIIEVREDAVFFVNLTKIRQVEIRNLLRPEYHELECLNPPPDQSIAKLNAVYALPRLDGLDKFLPNKDRISKDVFDFVKHRLQTRFYNSPTVFITENDFHKSNSLTTP